MGHHKIYPVRRPWLVALILIGIQPLMACTRKSGEEKVQLKEKKNSAPSSFYIDTPLGVKVIPEEQVKGDEFNVEGDIVVRKEWLRSTIEKDLSANLAFADISYYKLWPTMTIAYAINGAPTPDIIRAALAEWGTKTGIQFVVRTTEFDYLSFIPQSEGGGRSYVGQIGGGQSIWIGPNCPHSCIAHEIGHALGLWHEHARPDRDQYISVFMNNIAPGFVADYSMAQPSTSSVALGPYDSSSVMHYPSRSGGCLNTALPCILRKDGSEIPYDKPVSGYDAAAIMRRFKAVGEKAAVDQAYRDLALGFIDQPEWVKWFNNFTNGGTITQMRATLANLPEVGTRILQIYRSILERDHSSAEMAVWVDYLKINGTIDGIRKLVADTTELENKIKSIYSTMLERDATAAEIALHKTQLGSGSVSTTSNLRRNIANSPDALLKITGLYTKVLNRPITAAETTTLRTQLTQGISLKQVREQMIVSTEANLLLTKQFTDVLNRAPLDTERIEWQDALRKGDDTVVLRSRLVDGIESQQILKTVYQNIFEKSPSPEAAKKMSDSLRSGTTNIEVRQAILDGNQVKKKIVRIINEFTGRDATADKIAEHVLFLKSGKTTLELRNIIAAQSALVTP